MNVVLVSTYDLGHQPFGIASPTAWLKAAGHQVTCVDLSLAALPSLVIREANLIAFWLPMHTATRLAVKVIGQAKLLNPSAHLCCYGLYAPMNADYLRSLGVQTILGGEFEQALLDLANGAPAARAPISLDRLQFLPPDRTGLPALTRYSKLRVNGTEKRVGYTETSRGCKHLCRHCPVVPVYNGVFRVVQPDVVMEDIRRQVAAGAGHITFGDPDFFNGPTHARRIVEALHTEFPGITYDATIKIEHLRNHRDLLPILRDTGCLFVISAVESVEDEVLQKLDKGHTRQHFVEVVSDFRKLGLTLTPTFIPFTPWTTRTGYGNLLGLIADLDLIENVSPIQLALRLLIPAGSRLLELPEIQEQAGSFDHAGLTHGWKHPDPAMDTLAKKVLDLVNAEQRRRTPRREVFRQIWETAKEAPIYEDFDLMPRATIPYMDEPWYC
ncbi:MAG: CUAEP/CCAEP-tail radical SAM protein [Bryobacteraceae bacterium]